MKICMKSLSGQGCKSPSALFIITAAFYGTWAETSQHKTCELLLFPQSGSVGAQRRGFLWSLLNLRKAQGCPIESKLGAHPRRNRR